MISAVSRKHKKAPAAAAAAQPRPAKQAPASRHHKSEAVVQRRELAMLLRSIKTLVHQSP